jgi:hypothetical protein
MTKEEKILLVGLAFLVLLQPDCRQACQRAIGNIFGFLGSVA